jgi:hypothetical protein
LGHFFHGPLASIGSIGTTMSSSAMHSSVNLIGTFCPVNRDLFPCNASVIVAVSLGLGTGLLSLIFVAWLYHQVCILSRVKEKAL